MFYSTGNFSQCRACNNEFLYQKHPYTVLTFITKWCQVSENFVFNGIEIFMVHVIFNLIKNSLYYIKAIRKGEINIWSKQGETHNYLYFEDTGKGIGKEILPQIFDSYFSQTPHGTGIGLAFCKQVMRNFLGDIECESREGEYTKFILRFPIAT